jgi:fumarate hydratase class II
MDSFRERALDGAEPDRDRIAGLLDRSLMLVTALAPEIGYDKAASIAKHAHHEGLTCARRRWRWGWWMRRPSTASSAPRRCWGARPGC